MMKVRFNTGFTMVFPKATYVIRHSDIGVTDLYTTKGGSWIAQVPNHECVIESMACERAYMAGQDAESAITSLLQQIERERHLLPNHLLVRLKRALRSFNSTKRSWA